MTLIYCILILFLVYIAYIDIDQQRIPNIACAAILLTGFSSNSFLPSGAGLYFSLIGFLAGFLPMLLLHILTGIGAGDVKLMAALGSVFGLKITLAIFFYSFLISGLFACAYILFKGAVGEIIRRYARLAIGLLRGRVDYTKPATHTVAATQIPMAPGIALATGYVLLPQLLAVVDTITWEF